MRTPAYAAHTPRLTQLRSSKKRTHTLKVCIMKCGKNFACGEYSRTLRLTSELVDLRVANANSRVCCAYASSHSATGQQKKNTHL